MIQDIAPWRFRNEFQGVAPADGDIVLDIAEGGLLLASGGERPPLVGEWRKRGGLAELVYAFRLTPDDTQEKEAEGRSASQEAAGPPARAEEKARSGHAEAGLSSENTQNADAGMRSATAEHPCRAAQHPSCDGAQNVLCPEPSPAADGPSFPPCTGELRCFLALRKAGEAALAPEGWQRVAPAALRGNPAPLPFMAATALHLFRWYDEHRFCGRCGAPLHHSRTERALLCPSCGLAHYPVIAPCVLVAVTHGDSLLLTRYARPGATRLVLVAGFVEIGETAEQAAAREVMEETGLHVTRLRCVGSQPWGLSGTLATGFVAELDGPDAIRLDTSELAEARWVKRADIPPCEDESSLTMAMITRFARGEL